MKDPAVLFYTSDFISGTLTMSDAQRGQYIMLLCIQHQKGFLTEKDMLKICNSYDEDIWNKFTNEDGKYYNHRMRVESEKRRNYSESRRQNRRKGHSHSDIGDENKKDMINMSSSYEQTYETTHDNHMGNENINENINKDIKKGKKNPKMEIPPSIEDVKKYCQERKNNVSVSKWFDFYQSKGWMIGKNKMKDWKAAVRTWENDIPELEKKQRAYVNEETGQLEYR